MKIKGKAWKFGRDVNTDLIVPAKYLNISDPQQLGAHCMEGIEKGFSKKVVKGDIIVAGKNFGCGSSREHATLAIKGCGASCVIAESFARIFYRNSINVGLPIFESPQAAKDIHEGDVIEVDIGKGEIYNLTKKETYVSQPFPKFMQEIIESGGLLNWVKRGQKCTK